MQKLLLIALALFVLYKLVTHDKGKKEKDDSKLREKKIATGELVKDPSCGSYVDVEGSISVRDGQTKYYFCSYECREKFLEKIEADKALEASDNQTHDS